MRCGNAIDMSLTVFASTEHSCPPSAYDDGFTRLVHGSHARDAARLVAGACHTQPSVMAVTQDHSDLTCTVLYITA